MLTAIDLLFFAAYLAGRHGWWNIGGLFGLLSGVLVAVVLVCRRASSGLVGPRIFGWIAILCRVLG